MCGGGSMLGAALGAYLAAQTGGASMAVGAGLGAAAGNAKAAAEAQQTAAQQAVKLSQLQADLAYSANQRQQSKTPDVGAMLSGNQQSAKGGASSTMLTGPSGIDPTTLNLGKNTLLGS
jgi:hypothetical protein